MTRWSIFWHFLNCYNLAIFVNTISIFSRKWIIVFIFNGKLYISFIWTSNIFSHISKVGVVCVIFYKTLFCCFTIVNRSLNFWSHDRHSRYDTLNRDKLINEIRFETSRSDVVLTKVTFKINVVLFYFRGESFIICICESLFFIVTFLVIAVVLHNSVELRLKNVNSFDGVLGDISCEILVELS